MTKSTNGKRDNGGWQCKKCKARDEKRQQTRISWKMGSRKGVHEMGLTTKVQHKGSTKIGSAKGCQQRVVSKGWWLVNERRPPKRSQLKEANIEKSTKRINEEKLTKGGQQRRINEEKPTKGGQQRGINEEKPTKGGQQRGINEEKQTKGGLQRGIIEEKQT